MLKSLQRLDNQSKIAIDFETTGLDVSDPAVKPIGIGVGTPTYAIYIPMVDMNTEVMPALWEWLSERQLIAHNVVFDGAFIYRETGKHANWNMCTYAMFKYLATEGWLGQRWKLEVAQVDVLGWDKAGDVELAKALKDRNLTKDRMIELPVEIVGEYCCMDVLATAQLAAYFESKIREFPVLREYFDEEVRTLIECTIEQQLRGIVIDRDGTLKLKDELERRQEESKVEFLNHPDNVKYISRFNNMHLKKILDAEPPKFKKDGVSVTKRWESWRQKIEDNKSAMFFKITSKDHLRWLFFEQQNKRVLKQTEKGQASVDESVLVGMGEAAKPLVTYNKLTKELQYVNAILEVSARDGKFHPSMKIPGTVTGRASGGSLDG